VKLIKIIHHRLHVCTVSQKY